MAGALLGGLDFAMREMALFAAVGFLILAVSDLMVDLLWLGLALRPGPGSAQTLGALAPPRSLRTIAVFIPAWDEAGVIGAMLRHTLKTFDHPCYRLYVGCYPNDPATIAEVETVVDPRVRLVVGETPGPTTKADCLNRLWERMLRDEAEEGRRMKAVVLHDAEDVVHPAELTVFDRLIEDHDFVQLPVVPLVHPRSRWVSGHYADEFAESHGKELLVRQRLGAALPSAGVGCAFSRAALSRMARTGRGLPFDAASLTEDYEFGLKLRASGASQLFLRIAGPDGRPVASKGYFPLTFDAAINQKARWMTGIALAGWDRLGWGDGLAERWMRLRDRQSLLAAVLLACGYASLGVWLLLKLGQGLSEWSPRPISPALASMLRINLAVLVWRLALRFGFVAHGYGWRQALLSIPRMAVANLIAMMAAWRAIRRYRGLRGSSPAIWDKTAHSFPAELRAE